MSEDVFFRVMMLAGMVLAALAGAGTILLVGNMAMDEFTWQTFGATTSMATATVGFGWSAIYLAGAVGDHKKVFENAAEREVLTMRQRQELRRARGEVLMERALIDVEHERQNITHRQIEASNDPTKPPHQTSFTPNAIPEVEPISAAINFLEEEARCIAKGCVRKKQADDMFCWEHDWSNT